jgi:hypothetical protein
LTQGEGLRAIIFNSAWIVKNQVSKPNLVLLNNAFGQTGWQGGEIPKGALRINIPIHEIRKVRAK